MDLVEEPPILKSIGKINRESKRTVPHDSVPNDSVAELYETIEEKITINETINATIEL